MAYGMPLQGDPTDVMGRRIVAYLIDFLLLAAIGIAIFAVTKDQVYTGAPAHACESLRARGVSGSCVQIGSRVYVWKGSGLGLGYGIGAVASILDLVVLQAVVGASIGKLIMGLRVVDAQGQKAGFGPVLLRWILLIFVDNLCFLIGLLTASLTHPHRRVGDMAAGTYVVALADVGRPVLGPAFAGQYGAYGQPGPAGWVPPGGAPQAAPGWGAPPAYGGPQAQPGGWTAPPPPQPTWGAPPATSPPGWGAPPPAESGPPTWGSPPAPAPQEAPGWGATPPTSPASPTAPGWADPTPPPPAPAAPPTEPGPLGWDSPPPSTTPPPPPPAADPPAPEPPAPEPPAPAEGESWWNKALNKDDEPEQ
ncbi:MAG: hypothetical protein QOE62_2772 [Actinomycetota bacterium]|jgi:uncharacterized RDD family membrane protein YckC|nr:hypothetical protein [Actinomycetota bacterium]